MANDICQSEIILWCDETSIKLQQDSCPSLLNRILLTNPFITLYIDINKYTINYKHLMKHFFSLKNHFKFPQTKYWVVSENLLPIGEFETTQFPQIGKFCAGMETKEVENFKNIKEMEVAVKKKLLGRLEVLIIKCQ